MNEQSEKQSSVIEINQSDLPLHCPLSDSSLWSSHPRVFLPIEETGEAKCPYCGTEYKLAHSKAI
jgi:uncharacterized Zn-finger protein